VNRHANAALIVLGVVAVSAPALQAQAGKATIRACSLVPKEEVKRHLPWVPALDQFPVEEEPVGNGGSSCNYPSATIQVMPFSQSMIDMARKKGGLETLKDIGDEAYFYNNPNGYAEVYAKTGKYLVTVQANARGKVDAVKPGAMNLAKALVAKLR
jgi:hypothetical protein